jgi:hypothetical protein
MVDFQGVEYWSPKDTLYLGNGEICRHNQDLVRILAEGGSNLHMQVRIIVSSDCRLVNYLKKTISLYLRSTVNRYGFTSQTPKQDAPEDKAHI